MFLYVDMYLLWEWTKKGIIYALLSISVNLIPIDEENEEMTNCAYKLRLWL